MTHITPNIPELLHRFELDLRRTKARLTVVGYLQDLRLCCAWLETHLKRELVLLDFEDKATLQAWIDALREGQKRKPSTIGRKTQGLRKFIEFLRGEKLLGQDIGSVLKVPPLSRRLPRSLTQAETELLLGAPLLHARPEVRSRDVLGLELGYGSGMRAAELCALDLCDVQFDEPHPGDVSFFIAKGKGNKEGRVPCGPVVYEALKVYLTERDRLRKGKDTQALFLTTRGHRLTRGRLHGLVQYYGRKVGIRSYPHVLRHSCAQHMLDEGADLRAVQCHLRHDDIATTVLYTQCPLPKMAKDAARYHPRFLQRRPHALRQEALALTPGARQFVAGLFLELADRVGGMPAALDARPEPELLPAPELELKKAA